MNEYNKVIIIFSAITLFMTWALSELFGFTPAAIYGFFNAGIILFMIHNANEIERLQRKKDKLNGYYRGDDE